MAMEDKTEGPGLPKGPEMKTDILELVGGNGPWQRKIFLVVMFCGIPMATHNLGMAFLAPNTDHWCARPPGSNISVKDWKEFGLPENDKYCSRYTFTNWSTAYEEGTNLSINREVSKCDSWEYDKSVYSSTVLSKFDLVCDHEWFISLSKSIFIAGYMFSVITFGHVADRFGRRKVIAVCHFIAAVAALVAAFSVSFLMFAVSRFFIAVGIAAAYNVSFVLLMEVIGPEYRSGYGMMVHIGWSIGYISLPGIAWLLRDWFWIQIVSTIPNILLISSWWLLPESPRWQLANGQLDEAHKTLRSAGKMNGVDGDFIQLQLISKKTEVSGSQTHRNQHANALQLCTPGLRKKTCIVFYAWFVIAFVYYGLSYNTNELAGNPFINFAAYGAVEVPAYVSASFIIHSWGRRNPLAFSLGASGVACFLMYPIPSEPWWMSVVVSLIGKFFITAAFCILYVITAEIFPTVVRNIGIGSSSTCGRFGSIIAPFVKELGTATHPVVPQIAFGVLAISASILMLLLPETNNSTVPDTLEEAAEVTR